MLAEKLEVMEKGSESRVAIKAEVKRKKKASRAKKTKRKYRALEEGKGIVGSVGGVDEEDDGSEVDVEEGVLEDEAHNGEDEDEDVVDRHKGLTDSS